MTVIQLECFMEIVKWHSFSRAASELYLSQSSLSRHIQSLEQELRTQLFDRSNNTIRLTPLGEELAPHLRRLYQEFRRTSFQMHDIVDRRTSTLKIGVQASLQLDARSRQAIRLCRQQHPELQLKIFHLDVKKSFSALMGGEIDLLLSLNMFMPPSDKLRCHSLPPEHMCLAVPSVHPNAGLADIAHCELSRQFPDLELMLINLEEFDAPVCSLLKETLSQATIDRAYSLSGELASLDSLLMMVDNGVGMTFINENCVLKANPLVRLIPLVDRSDGNTVLHMANATFYWVEKNKNPLIRLFIDTLEWPQKEPT